jgi:lysophospholipase L1-like esterase
MWNSFSSTFVRSAGFIPYQNLLSMRVLAFSLTLGILAFLCRLSPAAEIRDLILVAGQSNAVGYDATPAELPADPSDKNVLFWWRCGDPPPDEFDSSGQGWTTLQAQPIGRPMAKDKGVPRQYGNFSHSEGGFGPEIGAARTLQAREPKRALAVLKAAFSGTGLRADWDPEDPGPAGACYRALVEETKKGLAKAKENGIELRPRALVWVQGESNANGKDAPVYAKNLASMITRLRQDLGAPQLIALVGVNTNFGNGKNAFMPEIVAQQRALATKLARCAYVDTSGVTYANAAHFDTAGTLEIGKRFAEALLKLEGAAASESTNTKESSQRKTEADAALDKDYQAWKTRLPLDQQAWETVLEQNLGSFYLQIHKREKVQGRSNAWDFVQDDPALPRVLLIGDSVSRGYTQAVRKALAGKANVHRAPENCGPTANGLKKLDVWLGSGKWDVIHFNFGIHDRATPALDYEQRLEEIVTRLKATGAKVIWASTTPVPADTKDGPAATQQIVEKNEIAAKIMKNVAVAVDDLFGFITPQLAQAQNPRDVHFNGKGYDLLGGQVAVSIESVLKVR